jgi:hypothetical protein
VPEPAAEAVVSLLATLAIRRHGSAAVIRALARRERAPTTIVAI